LLSNLKLIKEELTKVEFGINTDRYECTELFIFTLPALADPTVTKINDNISTMKNLFDIFTLLIKFV
jgi:hypothetical protein